MKLIIKGQEPKEWVEHRLTQGAVYEPIQPLRNALYGEQGGICAYCMRRLQTEPDLAHIQTNRIEHLSPQSTDLTHTMEYTNMVMCCSGWSPSIETRDECHCDNNRGNQPLSLSPLDPKVIDSLSYGKDGSLISSNLLWNQEINTILNLNNRWLKSARSQVREGVINSLNRKIKNKIKNKKGSKDWTEKILREELQSWEKRDATGLFKPYSGMVITLLRKYLRKAQSQR
ncbi:MAG: hypothetical protein LUD17_07265 [Bacteroidales bacterium]|nr:hypothetical protein [Bacteroidales bacterium]